MKLLKRLFHKHKYIPCSFIDVQVSHGVYKRRHIWKCKCCGREKWGRK